MHNHTTTIEPTTTANQLQGGVKSRARILGPFLRFPVNMGLLSTLRAYCETNNIALPVVNQDGNDWAVLMPDTFHAIKAKAVINAKLDEQC